MDSLCKGFLLTMVVFAAVLVSLYTISVFLLVPAMYGVHLAVSGGTLVFLLVAAYLLHQVDADFSAFPLKRTAIIGILFAVVGYVIVVAIGVQYLTLHGRPTRSLLWLAPVTVFWATEGEPPWTFLLMVIAPLNAALHSGIAIAVASIVQRNGGCSEGANAT